MKIIILCLLLSLSGKIASENEIEYRELTWNDFRGPVPENDRRIAARTVTSMEIEQTELDGATTAVIRNYFLADKSFVRVKSEAILRHEQTHFKIAQIAALWATRQLAGLNPRAWDTQKKITRIYRSALSERDALNIEFDEETENGLKYFEETEWEAKISTELNKLQPSLR